MAELKLRVFNRRRDSHITIKLTQTSSGWHLSYNSIKGDCSEDGAPFLRMSLQQEGINFPEQIESYVSWIWERLHFEDIDAEEAQTMMNDVASWINSCEESTPKWSGYNC